MSSVELHQVKTLGVARDPDAGTKLCSGYIVDFKLKTYDLSNYQFSVTDSLI
jgi:hypothetical protein